MRALKAKFHKLQTVNRLYQFDRPVIGLTGGIATGKSTVTKLLKAKGLEVIDADQLVKKIYQKEEARFFVRDQFPQAFKGSEIDFKKLRELFFEDPKVKAEVEAFIYKKLPEAFKEEALKISHQSFYIYDVPLLFEKSLNALVDLSVVVYAPRSVQRARLMDRDGHVEDMANKILSHQMDIEEKKAKADFVINNSQSIFELGAEVDQLLNQILD
jgi:dephospho-CoA kinase